MTTDNKSTISVEELIVKWETSRDSLQQTIQSYDSSSGGYAHYDPLIKDIDSTIAYLTELQSLCATNAKLKAKLATAIRTDLPFAVNDALPVTGEKETADD